MEICQVERQISEGKPQATSVKDMTPLAQPKLEHGQNIVDSKLNSIVTPVDHVEPVEQGSMAPPVVISTDNLLIHLLIQLKQNSLICQVRTQMILWYCHLQKKIVIP